jgi:hypothetical protein
MFVVALVLAVVLVGTDAWLARTVSFHVNRMPLMATKDATTATGVSGDVWPGDRPPVPTAAFLSQFMDAAWGRGRFRTEVWADDVNPMNAWWEAFAPSAEEQEAANAGYDFGDVEAWCKAQGVDYEHALASYKAAVGAALEQAAMAAAASDATFSCADFERKRDEFMSMQKKAFEVAFRLKDDRLQARKGQPSLADEDMGVQWKNNPVS